MELPETKIALSKTKLFFLMLGALAFVLFGVWILFANAGIIPSAARFNNSPFIYCLGTIAILFFGLCGLFALKKILDDSPGLILNEEGIFDNSSGVSAGLVPWSEILNVRRGKIQGQEFLSVLVKNPEPYINRGNVIQRMANRANLSLCGTPINISANSLKITLDELIETVEAYFQLYQSNV